MWLTALGVAVAVWLVLQALRRIVIARVTAFAQRTSAEWDDAFLEVAGRTRGFFLFTIAVVAGAHVLDLRPGVAAALRTVAVLAFLVQAGIWASAAVRFALGRYQQRQLEANRGAATMMGAVSFLAQMLLWSAVLLLALDNMGVDITALVAGLGIGGVAIALAVQNILGDLFASLAIVLDKPFVLKDFIIVDEFLGSVEHIGLKTTRLRSLSGEQLVFSNNDLLSSRIRNYGRMFERRVVFQIRVAPTTPRERLLDAQRIIREAIEEQPRTRFDRAHFGKYGTYSLEYEAVYYVLSPEYNVYMDTQQAINLRIHELFEEAEIEMAWPATGALLASA